jgi:hypothetical protein
MKPNTLMLETGDKSTILPSFGSPVTINGFPYDDESDVTGDVFVLISPMDYLRSRTDECVSEASAACRWWLKF